MTRLAIPNDLHGRLRLAYAAICFFSGVSMVAIYCSNRSAWQHGITDRYILYYAGFFLAFAFSLVMFGSWAEIVFAAVAALMGVASFVTAVLDWRTAPEAMMTCVPVGLVLMAPAASITIAVRRGGFFTRGA